MLVGVGSVAFLVGSLSWASQTGAGFASYAVATVVGLILGASNAVMLSKIADLVTHRLQSSAPTVQERYLRLLYGLTFLWALLAAGIGHSIVWLIMDAF